MKAKLIDFAVGLDGMQRVTFALSEDFRSQYDELHDLDLDVTVKKYRRKRSLDANAYAWVLIDKLASVLTLTKEEIYREAIRNIGGVSDTVCIKDEAVESLTNGWKHNGLGWFTETVPSKLTGCTNVILYYGSSTYDTKQMSSLIDVLVEACKAQGIETLTPDQLSALEAAWQ